MFTSLQGRSVVVTGGSKGIGKGIARVFARAGCKVLIAARDEATLAAAADELAREHEACEIATVIADVAKVEDCRRIAAEAVEAFGGIDVLCANAGVFPDTKLVDTTEGLDELGEDYIRGMEAAIPQKRLGSVEDIGYAALYFATDEAAYVTGQQTVVDGGQVLPESPEAMAAMEG